MTSITEDILRYFYADSELSKLFVTKKYTLKGIEYIFMRVVDSEKGVDLESILMPLDSIFSFFSRHGIYNLIFSLKSVITLIDIAFSIVIRQASDLASKGGELILCDANKNIISTLDILGLSELLKYYSSEKEMLDQI